MICEYGCGQEAKYQLKNGKWCCSKSCNSCPEMRKKNSKANSGERNHFYGKKHTKESRKKIKENLPDVSGKNNPMHGKHHSEKTRKLISEANIGTSNYWYGKRHTEETKAKQREANIGENNPMFGKKGYWSGKKRPDFSGPSHHWWNPNREEVLRGYTQKFYNKDYRRQILEEQKYICPICNKKLKGRKELHHIDNNKQNDNKENLIFLHQKCHGKTKGKNRNYWKRKLEKR